MSHRPAAATFAAPRARRALWEGRRGAVELVLSRGMYVRFGEDWVGLAEPGAEFGPLSIEVRGLPDVLARTVAGAPARVAGRRLIVGECVVSVERGRERRCVAIGRPVSPGGPLASVAAGQAALSVLGAPPTQLRGGIEQLASGAMQAGVRALAGLGDGLTPAGDDVLAGYAAWSSAVAGRTPRLSAMARGRSSPLGLAYLRAAEQGELPDAGAALLAALLGGSPAKAATAAHGLGSWGASSGAALGWGIIAGAAPMLGAHCRADLDRRPPPWRPCVASSF